MGDIFKKIIGRLSSDSTRRPSKSTEDLTPWQIKNQSHTNHFSEILILPGHTDIVRLLLKIDKTRFASASDDTTVIIWDSENGDMLLKLEGHTLKVTCMLLLSTDILITGSADKSLRMWDLNTGQCIKHITNCHQGSVQCLTKLGTHTFCSGGNDGYLCIWKTNGDFIDKIKRQEDENLNCLLVLPGDRIVTGSNGTLLFVYCLASKRCLKLLSNHRDAVRCLINLNCFNLGTADIFASGSLDGSIILWKTKDLSPITFLFQPETFTTKERPFMYSVSCLKRIGEKYLAASIGNSFRVYDINTYKCVMDCQNAHCSNVLNLITVYNGTQIVTSSADTSIRLWGTKGSVSFKGPLQRSLSSNSISKNSRKFQQKGLTGKNEGASSLDYTPQLFGDMWCHNDQVGVLLSLTPHSFASASNDGNIILWRDRRVESEKRNQEASTSLMLYNAQCQEKYGSLSSSAQDIMSHVTEDGLSIDNSPPNSFNIFN